MRGWDPDSSCLFSTPSPASLPGQRPGLRGSGAVARTAQARPFLALLPQGWAQCGSPGSVSGPAGAVPPGNGLEI